MYASIYLVVKDFDLSLDFYEKLFDIKVSAINGKRVCDIQCTRPKFTPKGMLQIKTNQVIDFERLKKVFSETLV